MTSRANVAGAPDSDGRVYRLPTGTTPSPRCAAREGAFPFSTHAGSDSRARGTSSLRMRRTAGSGAFPEGIGRPVSPETGARLG